MPQLDAISLENQAIAFFLEARAGIFVDDRLKTATAQHLLAHLNPPPSEGFPALPREEPEQGTGFYFIQFLFLVNAGEVG